MRRVSTRRISGKNCVIRGPMSYTPRNSRHLLLTAALISILMSYFLITQTRFDYQMESLFPKNDPELVHYQAFQDSFAGKDDYLALGIYNQDGLFQQGFLQQLERLTQVLDSLPAVYEATSLTNSRWLKVYDMGIRHEVPLIHIDQPARYARDSAFLFSLPPFRHNFYSDDGKATCVYLRIEAGLAQTARGDSLLQQVESALQAADFDAFHITGHLPSNTSNARKLAREMVLFTVLSILLVIVFLWVAFRALWGIVMPLVVVGLAALWAIGLMAAFGVSVNVMTVLLPSIMFVVATSDVVHLLSKYLGERRQGHSKEAALEVTVREVGLPTFLTSVTTGIGLLSLLISDTEPLQQLGVFASAGVMIAFVLTYMVLPPLLVLFPPSLGEEEKFKRKSKFKFKFKIPSYDFWPKHLHRFYSFILKHPKSLTAACVFLFILAGIGASQTRVHNYFAKDLSAKDAQFDGIEFFNHHFGGIRPFALRIHSRRPTDPLTDVTMVRELAKIDSFLLSEYGLNRPYSLVGMLKAAHSSLHRGKPDHYLVPADDDELRYLMDLALAYADSSALRNVLADANRLTRFTGTVPDWGSAEAERKNDSLMAFVATHIDTARLEVQVAGIAEMIDRSHATVTKNMLSGLLLALAIVGLLMGLLFRSVKMVFLSLIPNVFPLFLILGLIGFLGISLNMATAIIFTIAFGIAVDDTIHFITRLKLELSKGKSMPLALKRTFISTGKAIIITSLIISAGFMILMLSDFTGTVLTGSLISLTLILAVVADLVLLPLLMMRFK